MSINVIAHRGASFLAPRENTLEAFSLAIDMGADYIECDVRQTLDKELVIHHDEKINGKYISAMTYKELCDEASSMYFKVPLLLDVIRLCKDKIKMDIELKESGYEKKVVNMVTSELPYQQFMMKSFNDNTVAAIKSIDSKIKAGLLVGVSKGDLKRRFNEYFPERRLAACNADFISPHYKLVTLLFVMRMKLKKKEIYVWLLNDPKPIAKYIKRKVNGIITDKPDAGLFVRKQLTI